MSHFARLAAAIVLAAPVFAGGLYLTVGKPEASSDPAAKGAFMIVRPDGCADPHNVKVKAVAEGIVDGRRQSVALTPVALSKHGTYALRQSWPAEGKWVIHLSGEYKGYTVTTLVPVTSGGFERSGIRQFNRAAADADVRAALHVD